MKELLKAKSEFRKKGVVLIADKTKDGGGGSWKFAGEDNLIKTIQKPLSECGLELAVTMQYMNELGIDTVVATLYHIESGKHISSTISLPAVTPRKDKNGNEMYLDAEIERGKQFGYWSRILSIRLLGLSDIDPEDIKNRPIDIEKEEKKNDSLSELNILINATKDKNATEQWIKKTYNVAKITDLSVELVDSIIKIMKQKKNENTKA